MNHGRDAETINLDWLLRLRGCAVAGQISTILLVRYAMHIPLPLAPLFVLIGVELLSNVLAARRRRPGAVPALMVLDLLVLSGLLYFTGGPYNPFSFLYLVQIALASIILPARWTWTLVLLSVACSGVLFLRHQTLDMGDLDHAGMMAIHLRGMWVAYSVAASFIVYFLLRVTRALSRREAELQAARLVAARQERLASLATLAAGAAHELATPLSTIALVARELSRDLPEGPALADARLIRAEVERCRRVLNQMASDAGESGGEGLAPTTPAELADAALRGLPFAAAVRVEAPAGPQVALPRRALSQAARALLKNAHDAGPEEGIALRVAVAGEALIIDVRDSGSGMAPEVLARAGEPFYTTKPPGLGMGLGLFLVRAVAERIGGRLSLFSDPGRGTGARIEVPLQGAAAICRIVPLPQAVHDQGDAARA